jgi:hypothetical protein
MNVSSLFKWLILTLMFVICHSSICAAMEFTLTREVGIEAGGHVFPDIVAIHASGPIQGGDAAKFDDAAQSAERDQFGNIRLYLNSPGGSVAEAQKVVEVMDRYEVTAIVEDGDECISACASILFLSARIHLMGDKAELGFHACRVAGSVASPACNEYLSNDTKYRGTDFGASAPWLKVGMRDPEDVIYIDWRAAVLWGLIGPPTYDPTLAIPTFDCGIDRSEIAIATCADLRVARYEASLARNHKFLMLMKRHSEAVRQSDFSKLLSGISRRCGSARDCYLKEYGKSRQTIRSEIGEIMLTSATSKVKSESARQEIRAINARCRVPSECGRPILLDAPYEFAQTNFAILYAKLVAAEENGETPANGFNDKLAGTSDCVFKELCDHRVKTVNWVTLTDAIRRGATSADLAAMLDAARVALRPQEYQE